MARLAKAAVLERVAWWQTRLGLGDWDIVTTFGQDASGEQASCDAAPEYRHAKLHFDLSRIPVNEIERFVVHELLHTFSSSLGNCAHALARGDKAAEEWVRTVEEGLVTDLETLILRLTLPH